MIDDFSKYKFFYVNGSSFTEGGGLEEFKLKSTSVIKFYKELYNVTWNSRADVNWGKRLEEIIGIKCYNEAASGGGVDRVIRMTYDFIFKNWEDKDKFFIILEKPDSSRSDVFYTKKNKYFIINSIITSNNKFKFDNATIEYFNKEYSKNLKETIVFENWFENHYNFKEKVLQDEKAFVGLYSFCKFNNIKIFVMDTNTVIFKDCFEKNDIIKFSKTKDKDNIDNWCYKNKMTIIDEIKGLSTDWHPGYFGHIEYAKHLSKFIGWTGEFPKWPEYKIQSEYKPSLI